MVEVQSLRTVEAKAYIGLPLDLRTQSAYYHLSVSAIQHYCQQRHLAAVVLYSGFEALSDVLPVLYPERFLGRLLATFYTERFPVFGLSLRPSTPADPPEFPIFKSAGGIDLCVDEIFFSSSPLDGESLEIKFVLQPMSWERSLQVAQLLAALGQIRT